MCDVPLQRVIRDKGKLRLYLQERSRLMVQPHSIVLPSWESAQNQQLLLLHPLQPRIAAHIKDCVPRAKLLEAVS